MMRNVITVILCLLFFAPVSCGSRSASKKLSTTAAVVVKAGPDKFTPPSIPASVVGEQEKLNDLLLNYWQGADFSNKGWVESKDKAEEIFGEFIYYTVHNSSQDVSREALDIMLKNAEAYPAVYEILTEFIDKYLYDPNSPVRNEELYIVALESQIANSNLEDIYKVVPRERLKMAMKNRVGSVAIDFPFTTSKGVKGSLHAVKADYLLLFFYNLGCPACREVRTGLGDMMRNHPDIAEMLNTGRLRILALYPDTDMTEWDRYVGDIPANWTNAYDPQQTINDGQLYDLRAIPSLYLLDKNKKVLLKDFIDPNLLPAILLQE